MVNVGPGLEGTLYCPLEEGATAMISHALANVYWNITLISALWKTNINNFCWTLHENNKELLTSDDLLLLRGRKGGQMRRKILGPMWPNIRFALDLADKYWIEQSQEDDAINMDHLQEDFTHNDYPADTRGFSDDIEVIFEVNEEEHSFSGAFIYMFLGSADAYEDGHTFLSLFDKDKNSMYHMNNPYYLFSGQKE
ncbi:hypothetical protein BDR06DRAFT_971889 [Suillus hirtellus]|nr:hypothetical protein BDR06DRAFT_971889 [Suillus hirtellus]